MIYKFHLPENYKLKQFEVELARREIEGLFKIKARLTNNHLEVKTERRLDKTKLKRLTFIEKVTNSDKVVVPIQNYLDKTGVLSNGNSNEWVVRKREHNYLSHNFHRYKGKYYPQLINSIINSVGLPKTSLILDPFNGSGTTTLECTLHNFKSVGFDLNPLTVLIAKAKQDILFIESKNTEMVYEKLMKNLSKKFESLSLNDKFLFQLRKGLHHKATKNHEIDLPNSEYLKLWFPKVNLTKIYLILKEVESLREQSFKNIALTALSDIIKKYSYQDPKQIRVRRRKDAPPTDGLLLSFSLKLKKMLNTAKTFDLIKKEIKWKGYKAKIEMIDITEASTIRLGRQIINKVDMIITSPPYATALPYIDTNRLSLFLFNLLALDSRRKLENKMVGNREITPKERRNLEDLLLQDRKEKSLPSNVTSLIYKIYRLNKNASVGFRKKNKAATLYKYFSMMDKSFVEMYKILKKGGYYALIIGNSKTVAGKEKTVNIPTDKFLIDIAKQRGFKLVYEMPMTDQPMYMVHSKNAIDTETIFVLQK